ncbi:hypothetical protein KC19_VG093300 [Ceratodon purpureus]|uniref:Uncharacterized protein n=1 Tax=Ceratodon purpureus TaxID=3225 RepID=A0A8T0HNR9_CERPU|nr:hypothetical protein KC19_VG093300 [Ceratodon purpureus]
MLSMLLLFYCRIVMFPCVVISHLLEELLLEEVISDLSKCMSSSLCIYLQQQYFLICISLCLFD